MKTAVLIELDYKGSYSRYALTPEEFQEEFEGYLDEGMTPPSEDGDAYTLRPLVHVWYQTAQVGGDVWNTFFTDMSDGLPDSDIEAGNLAEVDLYEMKSLREFVPERTFEIEVETTKKVIVKARGEKEAYEKAAEKAEHTPPDVIYFEVRKELRNESVKVKPPGLEFDTHIDVSVVGNDIYLGANRIFLKEQGELFCKLAGESEPRPLRDRIQNIREGDAFFYGESGTIRTASDHAHKNLDESDEPWIVYGDDGEVYFEEDIGTGTGRKIKEYLGTISDREKSVIEKPISDSRNDSNSAVRNLIHAMAEYGMESNWTDSDIIEALLELGITQGDFQQAGFGNFAKDYFEEKEEKPLSDRIQQASNRAGGAGTGINEKEKEAGPVR